MPPEEPKPAPKPAPKPPVVKKVGEDFTLTAQCLKIKDFRCIEGEWQNTSVLYNAGKPVNVVFRVDAKGGGEIVSRRDLDGSVCRAPLQARMETGKLFFDSPRQSCDTSGSVAGQHVECALDAAGKTFCDGINEGSGKKYSVTLKRVR